MRTSLAALLAVAAATAAALPTISITGNKFFTSEGNQWFVKGKQSFLELHHLINYFLFPLLFFYFPADRIGTCQPCTRVQPRWQVGFSRQIRETTPVGDFHILHTVYTISKEKEANTWARAFVLQELHTNSFPTIHSSIPRNAHATRLSCRRSAQTRFVSTTSTQMDRMTAV